MRSRLFLLRFVIANEVKRSHIQFFYFRTYFLCLPCKESNKEKSPLLKFNLKICRYFPARFRKLVQLKKPDSDSPESSRTLTRVLAESTSDFLR